MNLSIPFCNIDFPNPLTVASGYLGVTGASMINCVRRGAGSVTSKTVFMEPRMGHPNPTVLTYEGGIINAVGLSGEGIHQASGEIAVYKKGCENPLIGSVGGKTAGEYAEVARLMDAAGADIIEANISCPNVEDEMGRPFACDPKATAEVTKAVRRATKKPITVKLSPNVANIGLIAQAAEAAGADAITAINTLGPGMLIDIRLRKPLLHNKVGGVSGPGIKPIAVKCVYDIKKAVKIPIIGVGGVTTGEDVIELMMAGASLVALGSALIYRDLEAFDLCLEEMRKFCRQENIDDINDIIGAAHEGN
ncbi:dihydroorotate dehydrogenase [Candidatus Peregrinibacteria bacterium]|nr:dihydroorotate dehydrogenase [Candidatus Peregrinibacteria bacterium]